MEKNRRNKIVKELQENTQMMKAIIKRMKFRLKEMRYSIINNQAI